MKTWIRLFFVALFIALAPYGWAEGLDEALAVLASGGREVVVSGKLAVRPDPTLEDVLRSGAVVLVKQDVGLSESRLGVVAKGSRNLKVSFLPQEGRFRVETFLPGGMFYEQLVDGGSLSAVLFRFHELPLAVLGPLGEGPYRLRAKIGWEKMEPRTGWLAFLSMAWVWVSHPVFKGESGVELGRSS